MDWDPISNFEKILLQQIEEIERLEFAEEAQNNRESQEATELHNDTKLGKSKQVNNVELEEKKEEENPADVSNMPLIK